MNNKIYRLIDENGIEYLSLEKGTIGGNKRLKIYGRLNCKSALRYIKNGHYVVDRVFFKDEETALKAGYRPCGICMRKKYLEWKKNNT